MNNKIRIIIADDNVYLCECIKKYLEQYEEIEILGIANTDEDEIKMIEKLKPEIVITDLVRNHKYTGLNIIKKYFNKKDSPQFLVISSDKKQEVVNDGLEVAGYIEKGFYFSFEEIFSELQKIKQNIK